MDRAIDPLYLYETRSKYGFLQQITELFKGKGERYSRAAPAHYVHSLCCYCHASTLQVALGIRVPGVFIRSV